MKAAFAGLAAAAVLAVMAGSQPAQAMPVQKQLGVSDASVAPTEVRYYRRHYVRRYWGGPYRRHYWGGYPNAYYGGYYPYRAYGYPYYRRYWGGPSISIGVGPFGFGVW
jgi:hypothetical protein